MGFLEMFELSWSEITWLWSQDLSGERELDMRLPVGTVIQADRTCGRKEPGMSRANWEMGPGHTGLLGHGEQSGFQSSSRRKLLGIGMGCCKQKSQTSVPGSD